MFRRPKLILQAWVGGLLLTLGAITPSKQSSFLNVSYFRCAKVRLLFYITNSFTLIFNEIERQKHLL